MVLQDADRRLGECIRGEDRCEAGGRQNRADFVDEARMLGLDTRGRAVAAEPLQAILDALARTPVAEVGLASSPNPVARRLRIDLAARLRRRVTLPVSEITARPALTT